MNLLIVILIVGLSCESSLGNPTLRHELKDIYDHIPHTKIYEITREYWENDVSMKVAVDYLKTEEFGSAWNKFFFSPEVSDILYWTQKNDVDVSGMFKYIAKRINQMNPMEEHSELVLRNPKSLLSFGIEIRKLIDWNVLQSAVAEKVEDGNDFAQLFMILKASKPALEKTFADEAIVTALIHLKDLGVDVDSIKSFIYSLLYWQ
ncbi:unnamed protein product [Diamesa hyperborea]